MIKLFASDLDGTLMNCLHETDGVIRGAIEKVTAAGLHVVPATGRSLLPVGPHGFSGLHVESCCANGAIIRDANGEILKLYEVDPAFVEEIMTTFPQICWDFATPDGMFVSGSYKEHQAGFKHMNPITRIVFRGMRARGGIHEEQYFDQSLSQVLKHKVCKVNTHRPEEGLARELEAFLAERADTVVNAPFNPYMFEITDKECNKGAAVAWLANYLGIEEDECAVYGDGGNDIDMLKRFKHSYATRGASDAAKAAASCTIGSSVLHAVPNHMLATLRHQQSHIQIS